MVAHSQVAAHLQLLLATLKQAIHYLGQTAQVRYHGFQILEVLVLVHRALR